MKLYYAQPFKAPSWIPPLIKYFWNMINIKIIGITAINDAANTSPHFVANCP